MTTQSVAAAGDTEQSGPLDPVQAPALLGRKSILLGMLATGLAAASVANASEANAGTVLPAALTADTGPALQMILPDASGTYTKPATGTPIYLAFQSAAKLPADWAYCLSTASSLSTPSMGALKVLGAPDGGGIEVEYQGAKPIVESDGTIVCAPITGGLNYRSEVVFQSDRTDGVNNYSNFRYLEGQRVRVAFDVMTHGLDAQPVGAWNSVFQSIGKSKGGAWPYSNLSINVQPGVWIIQGGGSVVRSELSPRTVHQDGVWTRWELDIMLGRAGVGYVSIWKDGEQLCDRWKMASGTFYGGTGNTNIDLSWLYYKNGLYGATSSSPVAPRALFRNRRFSVTSVGGATTTTWMTQQSNGSGLNLYRRNPVSDMPF